MAEKSKNSVLIPQNAKFHGLSSILNHFTYQQPYYMVNDSYYMAINYMVNDG